MKPDFLTKNTIMDLGTENRELPKFGVGDTVEVAQKVKEGNKERIQMFKGDVIAIHNNGIASTFIVRRIGADGIGVEKIFPYYSPIVKDIKLIKMGDVCRAKLYYVRDRVGKSARIKEKVLTKQQKIDKGLITPKKPKKAKPKKEKEEPKK